MIAAIFGNHFDRADNVAIEFVHVSRRHPKLLYLHPAFALVAGGVVEPEEVAGTLTVIGIQVGIAVVGVALAAVITPAFDTDRGRERRR